MGHRLIAIAITLFYFSLPFWVPNQLNWPNGNGMGTIGSWEFMEPYASYLFWWAFVGIIIFVPIAAISFVNIMEGGSLEEQGISRQEQARFIGRML